MDVHALRIVSFLVCCPSHTHTNTAQCTPSFHWLSLKHSFLQFLTTLAHMSLALEPRQFINSLLFLLLARPMSLALFWKASLMV